MTDGERALFDALKVIAENDGDAYSQKAAGMAVTRAYYEQQRIMLENLRAEYVAIRDTLTAELKADWEEREGGENDAL